MARTTEKRGEQTLGPLRISRLYPAPRELVFEAWSSAEHVSRWFCPDTFTVPEAKVEMRVGGAFDVCMRGPDGTEHWTHGAFTDVSPFDRLAFDGVVDDGKGRELFRAYTVVTFTEQSGGTRMDVEQTYTIIDPEAAWMPKGAPAGWAQTLDKLALEIARMQRHSG